MNSKKSTQSVTKLTTNEKKVLQIIKKTRSIHSSVAWVENLAVKCGMTKKECDDIILKLLYLGDLYEPSCGCVCIVSETFKKRYSQKGVDKKRRKGRKASENTALEL